MNRAPFKEAARAVVKISWSIRITNCNQVKLAQILETHCKREREKLTSERGSRNIIVEPQHIKLKVLFAELMVWHESRIVLLNRCALELF